MYVASVEPIVYCDQFLLTIQNVSEHENLLFTGVNGTT